MMDVNKKKILSDFIKNHSLGVIATVNSSGQPEAAVIEYGENDDLELIFDAFVNSRKCENLKLNNKAAFVIGWDENITVQYEGEVNKLEGGDLQKYKNLYFIKNPRARKWENKEGIGYYRIKPSWIRYSDLNKNPWNIFEVNL